MEKLFVLSGNIEFEEFKTMSRIGKLPIEFSSDLKIDYTGSILTIHGPMGKLSRSIMPLVELKITDTNIYVTGSGVSTKHRAATGLTRTLINNMVTGVSKGYSKGLEISGVGYRAEVKGNDLALSLGYSHPVSFAIPEGISIEVEKMTKVLVKGFDKELVGQTAAKIRSFRPPEPYKGKGIKYTDETIMRKAGKTGKK